MLGAMMEYRALEEAVSILKKYGKEVARLLNQEHEDPNALRYQLYVFRRRACRRLERFMRWEYRRKYGWLPSGKELKKVKGELYISEMVRGNMERAGAMIGGIGSEGEVKLHDHEAVCLGDHALTFDK